MASNAHIVIPSLCLPRIYHKFDENYVEQVFIQMFGQDANGNSCIDRIDLVGREDRRTGEPFWLAFVHFTDSGVKVTTETEDFVTRINQGREVNIQYCYPKTWFWKARKNNAVTKKNTQEDAPRPRIMPIQDQEEIEQKKTIIKKEIGEMNAQAQQPENKKIDWAADGEDDE